MYTLSIIVIAYKVEKYLRECLDSIVKQMTPEVEVLLIDDGSPDDCGAICDEYARDNEHVFAIHQPNGGASVARNTGMDHAHGEWITFVDGDDLLAEDAVQTMLEQSARKTADLILFQYMEHSNGTASYPRNIITSEMCLNTQEDLSDFRHAIIGHHPSHFEKFQGMSFFYPWGKMIRRAYLDMYHLRFTPGIRKGQDFHFTINYAQYLKEVQIIPKVTYYYRKNEGSISTRFSADILSILTKFLGESNRIISAQQDQVAIGCFHCFCLGHVMQAISLGAYHKDCPWKRNERIEWLKQLHTMPWVRWASKATMTEENAFSKRITSQLMGCRTNRDYVSIDRQLRFRYYWKPAIVRFIKRVPFSKQLLILLKKIRKK